MPNLPDASKPERGQKDAKSSIGWHLDMPVWQPDEDGWTCHSRAIGPTDYGYVPVFGKQDLFDTSVHDRLFTLHCGVSHRPVAELDEGEGWARGEDLSSRGSRIHRVPSLPATG